MSIITISRGTFSGGEALAERVAERLGYQCLSREMNLEAAAKEYGGPEARLTAAMDKRPSFWQRAASQSNNSLTFVRAVLCEQAKGGRIVYHGHLGHLLLPGISHVLTERTLGGSSLGQEQGGGDRLPQDLSSLPPGASAGTLRGWWWCEDEPVCHWLQRAEARGPRAPTHDPGAAEGFLWTGARSVTG